MSRRAGAGDRSTALLRVDPDGTAQVVLTNPTGCSAMAEAGTELGGAVSATVVSPGLEPKSDPLPSSSDAQVNLVHTDAWRKRKLCELVGKPALLDEEQVRSLHEFLGEHHQAFCLEDGEQGETDLVEMEIHTGDAPPRKQPARRIDAFCREAGSGQTAAEHAVQWSHRALRQPLGEPRCDGTEEGWDSSVLYRLP